MPMLPISRPIADWAKPHWEALLERYEAQRRNPTNRPRDDHFTRGMAEALKNVHGHGTAFAVEEAIGFQWVDPLGQFCLGYM